MSSVNHLSKDLSVCEAACRSAPDCAGFTFHGQGGGGLVYSSPCVLVTSCRVEDSRWCRDCVSFILGGCRQEEEVRMTSQRRMWVDESFDEEDGQAVLLLGGFALDHVHHVESVSVSQCPVSVQDMMEPVSRAVAGALGDKVMVCGGRSREEMYISRCQELDLTTWAWSQGERLQQGREDAASIVLSEELMVVTGGWDGERLLDSVELYSGQRRDWQEVDGWRMTEARYQHCSVPVGRSIIIAGGYPTLRKVEMLSLHNKGVDNTDNNQHQKFISNKSFFNSRLGRDGES